MKTEFSIGLLAAAYGAYVTWARIHGNPQMIGTAELVGSSGAVFFGYLVDTRGGMIPAFGIVAVILSSIVPNPLTVALTLFFFYAPYITMMLKASNDVKVLSRSVAFLSIGWMIGVGFPQLAPVFMLLGVLSSLEKIRPTRVGFLDAVTKLSPLLIPLILFTSAEYMAYVIVTKRFYDLSKSFLEFYFWYALIPGLTSALGSLVAPRVIEKIGVFNTLKLSFILYTIVIYFSIFYPPPLCYLFWSIPAYAFFEISLVRAVNLVTHASGAALGFTYTTMSLSSIAAPLFSIGNELLVLFPVVSYVILSVEDKVGVFKKLYQPNQARGTTATPAG